MLRLQLLATSSGTISPHLIFLCAPALKQGSPSLPRVKPTLILWNGAKGQSRFPPTISACQLCRRFIAFPRDMNSLRDQTIGIQCITPHPEGKLIYISSGLGRVLSWRVRGCRRHCCAGGGRGRAARARAHRQGHGDGHGCPQQGARQSAASSIDANGLLLSTEPQSLCRRTTRFLLLFSLSLSLPLPR